MTGPQAIGKRAFDLFCASVLAIVFLPFFVYMAVRIKRDSPGPVFFIAERMKTPTQGFGLFKFRTMTVAGPNENTGVTGGDKTTRITRLGARMRKNRVDELPQLWNVIRGDISLVGPRPPLREYVERCPELYAKVLRIKPGVTGLASLIFNRHESWLLSRCDSAEQTDHIYVTRCIPQKAALDLRYQREYSPCLDYWIIYETLRQAFTGAKGRKVSRRIQKQTVSQSEI